MLPAPAWFSIEEAFRQTVAPMWVSVPGRPEFRDPLLQKLQDVPLSRLIDRALDAHYNPSGGSAVDMISRVFRRFVRG